eukprot:scaffold154586_cov23-Tisochrysis_lutea.AAC.2
MNGCPRFFVCNMQCVGRRAVMGRGHVHGALRWEVCSEGKRPQMCIRWAVGAGSRCAISGHALLATGRRCTFGGQQ